jgi:hypothetical protein
MSTLRLAIIWRFKKGRAVTTGFGIRVDRLETIVICFDLRAADQIRLGSSRGRAGQGQ